MDSELRDDQQFSDGDSELGFYKFYYQLLSRRILPGNSYAITLDYRTNRRSTRLSDLMNCINRWCAKQGMGHPVRSLIPKDSKSDDLLQLADVLLGAVGYRWNYKIGDNPKSQLVKSLEIRLGRPLLRPTTASARPFNIWRWVPHKRQ